MKKFALVMFSALMFATGCGSDDAAKDSTTQNYDTANGSDTALDAAAGQDTTPGVDAVAGTDTTAGTDTAPNSETMNEALAICAGLEDGGMNFGSCGNPNSTGEHVDLNWYLCMGCYTLRGAIDLCKTMPGSCPGGNGTPVYFPECEAEYMVCINKIDPTAYDLVGGSQQIGVCQNAALACKTI